ncbi:thioesterase II family protein [Streptomyces caatingaensis]|uniref:Thioesterase domain-containing protein n=1 Tax=Streptomyces caatingaensis TaxID=1678637 RepID=A0A0K9XHQ0_9ACTN|nr:thioesterase domain-containing protein [Streptomyces caatingaensis]KNB52177.1 hypothetical protein AC230_11495 [Streptomyces caatingaensis]
MPSRTGPPRRLASRRERPEAALDLYVFPHAGGSAGEYLMWSDHLPDLQVRGVQYAGRASRRAEPAHTDVAALVDDLAGHLPLDRPAVFLGHSFGALVAYETARALRALGRPEPRHLLLSSFRPPHTVTAARHGGPLHLLNDEELATAAERLWGRLPDQVRTDPGVRALALAPLRADLTALETYRYVPGPPLDVPATLVRGAAEALDLDGWTGHLAHITGRHTLPGGHFHFRGDPAPLLDLIRDVTRRTAPRTGATARCAT